MIRTVTAINYRGEDIIMDLKNPWNNGFAITEIDGLYPPKASINSTELSLADGSVFNSSRMPSRNIVFSFKLLPNSTIAETRHLLYKYFPIKRRVKLEFNTETRSAYIYGYVESNEVEIFDKFETAQVSIICPYPYFKDLSGASVSMNSVTSLFTFPFSNPVNTREIIFGEMTEGTTATVIYHGDEPSGIDLRLALHGASSNIIIANRSNGQRMVIEDAKVQALTGARLKNGDVISIGTSPGLKHATLYRDDTSYSILSSLGMSPDWIAIEPGENYLEVAAINDSISIEALLKYDILYGGI